MNAYLWIAAAIAISLICIFTAWKLDLSCDKHLPNGTKPSAMQFQIKQNIAKKILVIGLTIIIGTFLLSLVLGFK
ncbi:hypothetical protein L1D14_07395 [Vibrio tubiashii]|uniref:hypothetical protein n=1 Tax=Vibrio tubiashii TaxID=29498 RepID=UPI001EFCB4AA|nr:hypothetical protein [Vibrio tubiashii]MCG9576062.1 hypothetical protein [Vibrio tubiashii]